MHYDQALERPFRSRIPDFEAKTRRHGKGWFAVDLAALAAPGQAISSPFWDAAALFGLIPTSTLIGRAAPTVVGKLLGSFPGVTKGTAIDLATPATVGVIALRRVRIILTKIVFRRKRDRSGYAR